MAPKDDLPHDSIPEYDNSTEITCPTCSHDGCPHSHPNKVRLEKRDAQKFMRWTESTLLTKHSRGHMPESVTSYPLEFDVHCLAVLKYDGLVIGPHYDPERHMTLLPAAREEQRRKREERRRKLSEAARRRAEVRRTAERRNSKKKK